MGMRLLLSMSADPASGGSEDWAKETVVSEKDNIGNIQETSAGYKIRLSARAAT